MTACDMNGYKYFGKWQELDQGSATAVVTKDANSDDIYLVANSIQTQAKIVDNSQWLKDETVGMSDLMFCGYRHSTLMKLCTYRRPRHPLFQRQESSQTRRLCELQQRPHRILRVQQQRGGGRLFSLRMSQNLLSSTCIAVELCLLMPWHTSSSVSAVFLHGVAAC